MNREFFQWLSSTDRLRIRFTTVKGKVNALVVQYEAFLDDEWRAIVRYDTAHGYFHKDMYVYDQKERIQKEQVPMVDLNQGLTLAIEDLEEHWENYKKRFMERS